MLLRITGQHKTRNVVKRTVHWNRMEPNRLRTEPTRTVLRFLSDFANLHEPKRTAGSLLEYRYIYHKPKWNWSCFHQLSYGAPPCRNVRNVTKKNAGSMGFYWILNEISWNGTYYLGGFFKIIHHLRVNSWWIFVIKKSGAPPRRMFRMARGWSPESGADRSAPLYRRSSQRIDPRRISSAGPRRKAP